MTAPARKPPRRPRAPPAPPLNGRQRLIDAALRLAARDGVSLASVGLRELAREAGLNHNTFYRHFDDFGELCDAAAHQISQHIMAGMKEVRRNAVRHADATRGAAEYFLDFVREHPQPIQVGLRELHSAGSPMRGALRQVLAEIADESVEQIVSMNLAPGLSRETLRQATAAITYNMFYRALDYLEQPRKRAAIVAELETFIRMQFLGAAAVAPRTAEAK